MADPRFIHLRVHTEYSLLEGAVPVKKLPALTAEMNMPAVAVTDTNNLFCALEFSEAAVGHGVQPIVGLQLSILYEEGDSRHPNRIAPVVLLAQNRAGYEGLMKLMSAAYLGEGRDVPYATLDELCGQAGGLILLTGGPDGPIGQLLAAEKPAEAFAEEFRPSRQKGGVVARC